MSANHTQDESPLKELWKHVKLTTPNQAMLQMIDQYRKTVGI